MSEAPKPHPVDTVGAFINSCTPPAGCTVAQVAAVIVAWNQIASPIIEAAKAQAATADSTSAPAAG